MEVHASNPSIEGVEAGKSESESSLVDRERPCLLKKKKRLVQLGTVVYLCNYNHSLEICIYLQVQVISSSSFLATNQVQSQPGIKKVKDKLFSILQRWQATELPSYPSVL